jgi:protein TonB
VRKFALLSLLLHLAAGALAYCYYQRAPRGLPESPAEVTAPLGDVFVQEESAPGAPAAAEAPPAAPRENEGEALPEEVKEASRPPETGGSPGLPDGEAQPLRPILPTYPPLSRKLGEAGEAVFLLGIDAEGNVSSATIERSSGFERLDSAAREAVQAARFRPATAGGQPVLSVKRYRIEFRLEAGAHGS